MKRWLSRLLIVLGATAVLLVAAEFVLGWTGLLPDPAAFTMRRMTTALQQDAAGRFTAHPLRWFSTAGGFRHSPAHLGRDATTTWPFRGRPGDSLPPARCVPRVLVVGDSCVYGASLQPCDTLGWRLQLALDAAGLSPADVAIVPLGVPGYSTEQLVLLLREGLATLQPVAVVLYPAAWNDQAPALRASDRELLAELSDPGPLDWARQHTRFGAGLLQWIDRVPHQELMASWNAGRPLKGWRVPAEDVGPNVAAMIADCLAAGAVPVVVAPPQPESSRREHPRTAADSRAVLVAAQAAGVTAVDGEALLAAAGGDAGRFFSDYVHPSPDGLAAIVPALVEPVAEALRAALQRREREAPAACGSIRLELRDVQPREAFALGDVSVRLVLDRLDPQRPPAVLVGGAALVGVRVVGPGQIEGTLSANGAGLHDVLVQSPDGVGLLRGGMRLLDPVLALEAGPPARLVVRARPGDQLRLLAGARPRETPQWSFKGALRLGPDARPLARDLVLDADGRIAVDLPALPPGRVLVQCLWAPAGEDLVSGAAARWTSVVEIGG